MSRETLVPLLVIGLVAGGGWYYREPLMKQLHNLPGMAKVQPAPEAAVQSEPAPRKDTIYRWVDDKGVVHYDQQQSVGSQAVVIDQSRIQSLNQYQQTQGQAQVQVGANGTPVVEANGSEQRKSLRAADRFPQTQIVSPP